MNIKTPLLIVSLFTSLQVSAFEGLKENFEGFDEKAVIPKQGSSAPGWSQIMEMGGESDAPEPGSAIVLSDAAQGTGKGLRLLKRYTFVTYEPENPLWTTADGAVDFKMDFRFHGKFPFDLALHNGRTSAGVYVVLNIKENTLQVSEGGGTSVYRPSLADHFLSDPKEDTWYTLEIRGLSPGGGNLVEGRLYLYETQNPMNILLDGVAVVGSGSAPFSEMKTITVRRWGVGESRLDLDNVILEPARSR